MSLAWFLIVIFTQTVFPTWPAPFGRLKRSGLQWLETSPILCQWVHNDNDWYLIKCNSDMRPCLWICSCFPKCSISQIDCLIWPTLERVNPNCLWRHECTLWRDNCYNTSANVWALMSVLPIFKNTPLAAEAKIPPSPNYSQSPSKIHWSQIELCQDCKIYVIILSHDFCDVIRELTITANTLPLNWLRSTDHVYFNCTVVGCYEQDIE